MKPQRKLLMVICLLYALIPAVATTGCAQKMSPPTIVANVSNHGTELMTAVKAVEQAVIDAQKAGAVSTDDARKSMVVFKQIGDNGQKAANLLNKLLSLTPGSLEQQTAIEQIQSALDAVDSDLFKAIVPIGDEATRTKLGTLAQEVSKTITLINRQILGGK